MVHVHVTDTLALFQTSDIHLCCSRNWSDAAGRTPERHIKKGMCEAFGFRLGLVHNVVRFCISLSLMI